MLVFVCLLLTYKWLFSPSYLQCVSVLFFTVHNFLLRNESLSEVKVKHLPNTSKLNNFTFILSWKNRRVARLGPPKNRHKFQSKSRVLQGNVNYKDLDSLKFISFHLLAGLSRWNTLTQDISRLKCCPNCYENKLTLVRLGEGQENTPGKTSG